MSQNSKLDVPKYIKAGAILIFIAIIVGLIQLGSIVTSNVQQNVLLLSFVGIFNLLVIISLCLVFTGKKIGIRLSRILTYIQLGGVQVGGWVFNVMALHFALSIDRDSSWGQTHFGWMDYDIGPASDSGFWFFKINFLAIVWLLMLKNWEIDNKSEAYPVQKV